MVNPQQTTCICPQQSNITPYQTSAQSVGVMQFLDMISILPTMIMMMVMMMMMGMMRDLARPGGTKRAASIGAKTVGPALAFIPYAGPALAAGASGFSQALEEKEE